MKRTNLYKSNKIYNGINLKKEIYLKSNEKFVDLFIYIYKFLKMGNKKYLLSFCYILNLKHDVLGCIL